MFGVPNILFTIIPYREILKWSLCKFLSPKCVQFVNSLYIRDVCLYREMELLLNFTRSLPNTKH